MTGPHKSIVLGRPSFEAHTGDPIIQSSDLSINKAPLGFIYLLPFRC